MTSHGGVFQIWIWPADCTGSFWESGCWRHSCDARSGLLSKSLWEAAEACRIPPGWAVLAGECVQAGGGDCWLLLAGHHARGNFKVPPSTSCPSPSPQRCESLSTPVETLQALLWMSPLEQEELWSSLVMAPGTCQTGSHPSACPRVLAAPANCTGCAELQYLFYK